MKKFLLALLSGALLLTSGCASTKDVSTAPDSVLPAIDQNPKQEAYDYIESHVRENVSPKVLESIIKISSYSTDGEVVRVTVRVYAADGAYIPQAAAEIYHLVFEAAEEKEYAVGKLAIEEYFEDMKKENEKTDFIRWETEDGETGTLVDDRPGKEVIKFNYSVDDLYEYFGVSKT